MNPMARRDIMGSWYLASLVKRYHTWPTLRIETIAEHSHGVAMLYMRMFVDPMDGDTLMRVTNLHAVRWILENDLAELWSGDAPFPVKMRFPNMREAHKEVEREANMALGVRVPQLPVREARRVKACDLLQMYLFGLHERRMGNTYALPIVRDALSEAVQVVAGDDYAVKKVTEFAEENDE
jgi:5'-deoxynucleotidase YfbR-like HD superfamily hydrolase